MDSTTGASRRLRGLVLLVSLALLATAGTAPAQTRAAKSVLLMYSEQVELDNYAALDDSLRATLQSGRTFPLEFYTEHLDLVRFGDAEHQHDLASFLRAKYSDRHIDLIVAVSSVAYDFLLDHREDIFPAAPIVFTSVNVTKLEKSGAHEGMTGVAVTREYGDTLDLILRLQPDTLDVVIPVGATPLEQSWMAETRNALKRFDGRVNTTYLAGLSLPDLLERLRRLPAHTVVLFSPLFNSDATGRHFLPAQVLPQISAASAAPIYGTNDSYLGHGIVGGALYELAAVGEATGQLGRRILEGVAPAAIPIETLNPNRRMFDARQMDRWRIDRARLPPDSVVLFDDPSIWDLYKTYILGSIALLLIEAAMILALVVQARRLKHSESMLKELSGSLLNAQDAERTRIARELHDDFGQRLALLKIELEMLAQDDGPQHRGLGRAGLGPLIAKADELAVDLHTLSHTLHSSRLQLLGLRSALEELCASIARQHSLAIDLRADDLGPRMPPDVALCLYRIAQEALHNAARHSGARDIIVTLTRSNGAVRLAVADSGKGFDPGRVSDGLGLASMRERARMIGGELVIQSSPGRGTTLVAQVRRVSSMPAA